MAMQTNLTNDVVNFQMLRTFNQIGEAVAMTVEEAATREEVSTLSTTSDQNRIIRIEVGSMRSFTGASRSSEQCSNRAEESVTERGRSFPDNHGYSAVLRDSRQPSTV